MSRAGGCQPARRFFRLDRPGGQLACEVWPGTGPSVVLLHSGIGDRRSWESTAPRLRPAAGW